MSVFSVNNLKQPSSNIGKSESGKKHTVLLVDDEESNLVSLKRLLDKSCNVLTALSGEAALYQLKQNKGHEVSMIISDQRMPKMTGVELFEKTIESHPEALRLIVSGYSDISAVIKAINKAHIYHFISKPVEPADFLITVKSALKTYDKEKENTKAIAKLQAELKVYKDGHQLKEMQLAKAYKKLKEFDVDPKQL